LIKKPSPALLRYSAAAALVLGATILAAWAPASEDDFITGRVIEESGTPEAGVWVIAESKDVMPNDGRSFHTYRKIVVTDDSGRFVLPQLPKGRFDLWVRGYGLADSKPSWNREGELHANPGDKDIIIKVARAKTPQEAAKIYPSSYWFSLLKLPPANKFPGDGNSISKTMESQAKWMGQLKLGCILCHQIGNAATRLTSPEAFDVGIKKVARMVGSAAQFGHPSIVEALGDWGQRILNGEVPPSPERPQGAERNVVITQWEVGELTSFVHDLSSTDRHRPTRNANGPVYAIDEGGDWVFILDPVKNTWERKRIPIHPKGKAVQEYFGLGDASPDGHTSFHDAYEQGSSRPHSPMVDSQERLWLTTGSSGGYQPDFCAEGVQGESFTMYDPKTGKFEVIPVCFDTHHLEFAPNGVLWTCSLGWFDPAKYDPKDPSSLQRAQGSTKRVIDSDGDGTADRPMSSNNYGVYPSVDGSIWSTQPQYPGRLNYFNPVTGVHETFQPPYGHGPRGVSVDSKGVVWTALAGSGHVARFDRSKCAKTWGMGQQCPEGWTLWKTPGPSFKGFEPQSPNDNGNADMHYYIWVDRFNASGLGENTVIVNGTGSDSQLIFNPQTQAWTTVRVPYPMNYYTRGADARIDDPNAGWKGRGIWTNYSSMSHLHTETRRPAIVHMQFRTSPLEH
jgi:hypothetical protein